MEEAENGASDILPTSITYDVVTNICDKCRNNKDAS